MVVLFGIAHCDTVKKARIFLETNQIEYEFINFKIHPPSIKHIEQWSKFYGTLPINKKGLTYRKHFQYFIELEESKQIDFIITNPSMLKRPILSKNNNVLAIGFNEEQYKDLLNKLL